jgi:hypothetical protein
MDGKNLCFLFDSVFCHAILLILSDLFDWIKDINWPVAQKIIPLLLNSGEDVIPIVKNILKTNHDMWKYWTQSCVIDKILLFFSIKRLSRHNDYNRKNLSGFLLMGSLLR